MSHNRSDWFNPNNRAYNIRQSQIQSFRPSMRYPTSYPCGTMSYSCNEKDIKIFEANEIERKKKIKIYQKIISNSPELTDTSKLIEEVHGEFKFTTDSIRIMTEFLLRREQNLARL